MTAPDLVWQLADELEAAPALFDDLPPRAQLWMRAWLSSPPEGCEHVAPGVVLYSAMGARRALCAPCARRARLDLLVSHCGRCGAPTVADDGALSAVYAVDADLIVCMTICSTCLINDKEIR
jgi:hypothetical protein